MPDPKPPVSRGRRDPWGEPLAEQLNIRVSTRMSDELSLAAEAEGVDRGVLVRRLLAEGLDRLWDDPVWREETAVPRLERTLRVARERCIGNDADPLG